MDDQPWCRAYGCQDRAVDGSAYCVPHRFAAGEISNAEAQKELRRDPFRARLFDLMDSAPRETASDARDGSGATVTNTDAWREREREREHVPTRPVD